MNIAHELTAEYEALKGDRGNWETMWQDIAELMIPRRADFTNRNRASGEQRRSRIYESTAVRAVVRAASGLHNTLTSNTVPWFGLETEDPQIMRDRETKLWLEEATRITSNVFNSPRSNFHSAIHEYYIDLVTFGTGVLFVYYDEEEGAQFRSYFLGDCCLAEDKHGKINSVYRTYFDTARSIVSTFDSVSDGIKKAAEKEPFRVFEIMHVVKPRDSKGRTKNSKPYASYYIEKESNHLLKKGGFDEFPFVCSRWHKNSQEVYGRGCGTESLPDVRMINEMERVGLIALQKMVDPPLLVPDDGFLSPVRTTPGGLNYFRSGLGPQDRITPLQTNGRIDLSEQKIGMVRQSIERAFYLDLLELPANIAPDGDILRFSATEIAARQRDRLQILGPIVARQESELLGPLVIRTLSMLIRNGQLPPAPSELINSDVKVVYSNPVAVSQRSGELASINQLVQFMVPFAQIDPQILQGFEFNRIGELAAEILKVSPSVFKTSMEREQEAQQQEAEQQRAMEMQQAMAIAQQQNLIAESRRNDSQAFLNEAKASKV